MNPSRAVGAFCRTAWMLSFFLAIVFGLQADTAAAKTVNPGDAECRFILGQSSWTVRWQARTNVEDGAFRLYAGQDLGNLRVVDMQQATPGIGSYQYEDMPDGSRWSFYQLRYVSGGGEETVLGTLRVDVEGMGHIPASLDFGSHGLKALQEVQPYFSIPSGQRLLLERITLASAAAPEPEVPPPRSLSG